MTRVQLEDELYELADGESEANQWASAWPDRAAAARVRRDQSKLNILAEFDRLYAVAYGPREVEA